MKKAFISFLFLITSIAVHAEPVSTNRPHSDLTLTKRGEWIKLFNGKTLDGWTPLEKTKYDMDSGSTVTNGTILLKRGVPYSAIIINDKFPKSNYEVRLRAMRLSNDDIFCGILFPVKTTYCSAVFGGWGNWIVGISCVDGLYADENNAGDTMHFDNNVWYEIRLRVTDEYIKAWVNNKEVISQELKGHYISPYPGLEMFAPFGIFTYDTAAAYDRIEFRRL